MRLRLRYRTGDAAYYDYNVIKYNLRSNTSYHSADRLVGGRLRGAEVNEDVRGADEQMQGSLFSVQLSFSSSETIVP